MISVDNKTIFVFLWEYGSHLFVTVVTMLLLFARKGSYRKIALSAGIILMEEDIKDV